MSQTDLTSPLSYCFELDKFNTVWGDACQAAPTPAATESKWATVNSPAQALPWTYGFNPIGEVDPPWHKSQQPGVQAQIPSLYNEAMAAGGDYRTDPNFPGENVFVPRKSHNGIFFIPYDKPVPLAPRGPRYWVADMNPAIERRAVEQGEIWREYEHHYARELFAQYLTNDWRGKRDPYTQVVQQPGLTLPSLQQQFGGQLPIVTQV